MKTVLSIVSLTGPEPNSTMLMSAEFRQLLWTNLDLDLDVA